jgi:ABC-type amino acid transport substrate-binding protein
MEIDYEAQGWKMVESGRAYAYFENINFLNRYIKNEKVDMGQYEIHIISERPLFARFSNTPKSQKLIEIYDSRMPELLEQDEIRGLFDKWGFPYPSFRPREGNDGVKVVE